VTWQLPVFVKDAPMMYLQVLTSTVQPVIVGVLNGSKLAASVGADGAESLAILDFGKLPVCIRF